MYEDQVISSKPLKVNAVRGPLTRKVLMDQGVDVPEIYGDPALLMPVIYQPERTKHYQVGVIPHYIDKSHSWVTNAQKEKNVLVIDVESDTLEFIDQVNRCEVILSSSLHGIICADAYRIPSVWIQMSDGVLGDGFKFRDYMLSVGRTTNEPIPVKDNMKVYDIVNDVTDYNLQISFKKLLLSCPFRNRKLWPDTSDYDIR